MAHTESCHMAQTGSHLMAHIDSSHPVSHRPTYRPKEHQLQLSITIHPTTQDDGHGKQASSSHHCSVNVQQHDVDDHDVDDKVSLINSNAPKPAGLSRSECANPSRNVLLNRFRPISWTFDFPDYSKRTRHQFSISWRFSITWCFWLALILMISPHYYNHTHTHTNLKLYLCTASHCK